MKNTQIISNKISIFKGKKIRKTLHGNEWFFVIVDVVKALTDSVDPSGYVKDLRRRDEEIAKAWGQIATPLSIETEGGIQQINCTNTEGIFRIIHPFHQKKPSHSNAGSLKLVMKEFKKLKTQNARTIQNQGIFR